MTYPISGDMDDFAASAHGIVGKGPPLSGRQAALHRKARERIEAKTLPVEMPATVWGGPGSGERCALCNRRIEIYDIEFEYAHGNREFRFHRVCHAIWQTECEQHGRLTSHA
jgi:hypothetical protein